VERISMERESSWREHLRGETLSVDRLLLGEKVFIERSSPWREVLRRDSSSRDSVHRENRAEERGALRDSLRGETSPRRDNLQGENISIERLFEERKAPGRTQPALNYKAPSTSITSLYSSVGLLPPAFYLYIYAIWIAPAYVLFYVFQGFDLI